MTESAILRDLIGLVAEAPDFSALDETGRLDPFAEWGSDPVRVRVAVTDVNQVTVTRFSGWLVAATADLSGATAAEVAALVTAFLVRG